MHSFLSSAWCCSAENFDNTTLAHHLEVMKEMIGRDKNHPSIVMWSLANEPDSSRPESVPYFKCDTFRMYTPTVTFCFYRTYVPNCGCGGCNVHKVCGVLHTEHCLNTLERKIPLAL